MQKSGVYLNAEGWAWHCYVCETESEENFGKDGREPARRSYKDHRKSCRSKQVAEPPQPDAAPAPEKEEEAEAPSTPTTDPMSRPFPEEASPKEGSTSMPDKATKKKAAKKKVVAKKAAKKKVVAKKAAKKKVAKKKVVAKKTTKKKATRKATARRSDGKTLFRFALIKGTKGKVSGIWVSRTGHFAPARAKKLGAKRAKKWGEVYAKSHAAALDAIRNDTGGVKWYTPSTSPSPSKK